MWTDTTRAQPAQNYISQIAPQLLSLYDQSVNQMLTHAQATLPAPQGIYVPYTNGALQKLFDELKQM